MSDWYQPVITFLAILAAFLLGCMIHWLQDNRRGKR